MMMRLIAAVLLSCSLLTAHAAMEPNAVQFKTLLQTDRAWDGSTYRRYPDGQPQLSVLEVSIPPHTTMDWHRHPIPNAAYVVSGELKVETQDGQVKRFSKGQVIPETVGVMHRGVTGDQPVELLVFYAGASGVPLSEAAPK
jgi:quercetin dioxygenase-like cupin family protein